MFFFNIDFPSQNSAIFFQALECVNFGMNFPLHILISVQSSFFQKGFPNITEPRSDSSFISTLDSLVSQALKSEKKEISVLVCA